MSGASISRDSHDVTINLKGHSTHIEQQHAAESVAMGILLGLFESTPCLIDWQIEGCRVPCAPPAQLIVRTGSGAGTVDLCQNRHESHRLLIFTECSAGGLSLSPNHSGVWGFFYFPQGA